MSGERKQSCISLILNKYIISLLNNEVKLFNGVMKYLLSQNAVYVADFNQSLKRSMLSNNL
jgi:hypothetical protein